METNKPWATAGRNDATASLADFQEGLPVRLIATPRTAFQVCRRDEAISSVVARNVYQFDHFPVVESGGAKVDKIIGLIRLDHFMHGEPPSGRVADAMEPLSEDNLIGADASLLTFIRSADQQRCRLIVSGREISGLVSLSDLQQLPVRAALFAMVTHLEMSMASAIRRELTRHEDWFARLPIGRQSKVADKLASAKSNDEFADMLLFTEFYDKVTILKKSPALQGSKSVFDADLSDIQSLRDNLAHANDYAATREAAIGLCETVRRMDHWISQFAAWTLL